MTSGAAPSRLLRRAEVERLRSADALLEEAGRVLAAAREAARRQEAEMVAAARARTLLEATRAANRVIAEAEGAAERRLRDLEPLLARLVSQTVAQVIGDMDRAEAVERATAQALSRLRDHRRARISASPDVVDAVRAAVAQIGAAPGAAPGAEVIEVQADERLAAGRTVLSSEGGHAEIGLDDLVAEAVRPFDGDQGAAAA